ncbi:hypothetical protein A6B43_02970 [Vespertiliibacter pulmonis]|uniref:Uncharacterized protein DUF3298 n=1 Tax=Vespertiliibacter pulmonis TaxID=1443036 RepID=A0A3N4VI15_9PAST|nr:RsiV family protein [Vespertiliibacter pulmonis]QLB20562.1 hypothetical protein A6B43_02970 [Vespertiliibacter pulmonis]RPE82692.1 uncharacterized protein DUF3298 [Vespertiliibacter pulmonis]
MKKSLIGLVITSVFLFSACDDKTSALIETNKKLGQLEADSKHLENMLMQKEQELDQLKSGRQAENCFQPAIPLLQVKTAKLLDKTEIIKFEKDLNNSDGVEQSNISMSISTAKTGVSWLDSLLLKNILLNYTNQDKKIEIQNKAITPDEVKAFFETLYQENIKNAKVDKSIGFEDLISTYYSGQRNNLAMFSQSFYNYSGGAHGISHTDYLNIDLNKKAIIQLDDVVPPKNQAKLKEQLWDLYMTTHLDDNGKFDDSFMKKEDFYISNNFYFTPEGIVFVYPVYALGSYSEGEVELSIQAYMNIDSLLNPEYVIKEE